MAAIERRSPKQAYGQAPQSVRDAIDIIEDRPRMPLKTPASAADDGFEGQMCSDSSYIYVFRNGSWKRAALASW